MSTCVAFYRGQADYSNPFDYTKAVVSDAVTRYLTRGPYSHCELAVPMGEYDEFGKEYYRCYSASVRDNGVRCKVMTLPDTKWDIVTLTDENVHNYTKHGYSSLGAKMFFDPLMGQPYDWFGAMGIIIGSNEQSNKWFCSEIVAEFLGYSDSWRISPNQLHSLLK